MRPDSDDLERAGDSLLSAVVLGLTWDAPLHQLAEAAHAHSCGIWDSRRDVPTIGNLAWQASARIVSRPDNPPFTQALKVGASPRDLFVSNSRPDIFRRISAQALYQDVLNPAGMAFYTVLHLGGCAPRSPAFLFCRSRTEGPFDTEEIAQLAPTANALRVVAVIAGDRRRAVARAHGIPFTERQEPVFLLDDRGLAVPINEPATRLEPSSPLKFNRGRLTSENPDEASRLVERIRAVVNQERAGSVLLASSRYRRYQLLLLPIAGDANDFFAPSRALAALVAIDAEEPQPTSQKVVLILQSAFDLTLREADIAGRIAQGFSPAQVATSCGIGTGTARNHLKSILRKCGLHSQAELAALVSRYL